MVERESMGRKYGGKEGRKIKRRHKNKSASGSENNSTFWIKLCRTIATWNESIAFESDGTEASNIYLDTFSHDQQYNLLLRNIPPIGSKEIITKRGKIRHISLLYFYCY